LDDSTDINGKAQLLAFTRFVFVMETSLNNFYFANHSQKQQKADILDVVDSYFSSHDLSQKSCISICMDGAPYQEA
jgi:hypothetical protein